MQQILSFSRRQSTERKVIALAAVVAESEHFLRATLPSRLTLRVRCAADAPAVLADTTQMQQVIINLVSNAMQAMSEGRGQIDIGLDTVTLDAALGAAYPQLQALCASHPGKTVRLSVSDDGPGMDANTLARIFEPFFTTKPVGEGTGLGLSVVHGIVQVHEGAIVAESAPGKGTTFTIYLPVAAEAATALVLNEAGGGKTSTPAFGLDGGKHILYLDDDDSLVFLVKRFLERRGYRVSGFSSQSEALAALRADPAAFYLLLTDYNMPGMSGLDVALEARSIRADLPVAITSGFLDETLRQAASAAGVRDLIFKAIDLDEFCAAVQMVAGDTGAS
ncbi:MAG: ATP-binding protein [Proteobacteria bacterium]|nr:ATP-binding protein [Pseudomonadota bacterium]